MRPCGQIQNFKKKIKKHETKATYWGKGRATKSGFQTKMNQHCWFKHRPVTVTLQSNREWLLMISYRFASVSLYMPPSLGQSSQCYKHITILSIHSVDCIMHSAVTLVETCPRLHNHATENTWNTWTRVVTNGISWKVTHHFLLTGQETQCHQKHQQRHN